MSRIAVRISILALACAAAGAAAQDFSGSIETGLGCFWDDASLEPRPSALTGRIEGKVGDEDMPSAQYRAEARAEFDPATGRSGVSLGEAWIKLLAGPLDIYFGNQIVAWSVSDVFYPSDAVNPWDLSVPADRKKMPVPLARVVLNAGAASIDLVAQPYWIAGKMPGPRWISAEQAALSALPHDSALDETPGLSLGNVAFGGRVKLSLDLLQGLDLGATYYRGRSSSPTSVGFTYAGMLPTSYFYVYDRATLIGADLTIAPGGNLLVRTEWGYTTLDDASIFSPDAGEASAQGVSGLEYRFGCAQIELEYVLDWSKGASEDELGSGLVAVLSWDPGSRASLKLAGACGFSGGGSGMVSPRAAYRLADALELACEALIFFGEAGTTYGDYAGNGLARASLKYSF